MTDDGDTLRRVYQAIASSGSGNVSSHGGSSVMSDSVAANSAPPPPQQAIRTSAVVSPLTPPSAALQPLSNNNGLDRLSGDVDMAEEDDVETLRSIGNRIGKSVEELRELNEHIADYDDDEPLPPGMKLVVKKKARRDAPLSGRSGGTTPTPAGYYDRSLSDSGDPRRRDRMLTATEGSTSDEGAYSASTSLRKLGARLRMVKSELIQQLPHLATYDLDDPIPASLLRNRVVNGVLLNDIARGSHFGESAPSQSSAIGMAPLSPPPLATATAAAEQNAKSSDVSASSRPLVPQLSIPQSDDRQSRFRVSHPASNSAGAARSPRPLSPVATRPTGAARTVSPRHRQREDSREHGMPLRGRRSHKIFVTPYADEGSYPDGDGRLTIRQLARHVMRCTVDDLLEQNPELETIFGVDDPIPGGTAVIVPPNVALPRQHSEARHYADDDSSARLRDPPPVKHDERRFGRSPALVNEPPQRRVHQQTETDDGFLDISASRSGSDRGRREVAHPSDVRDYRNPERAPHDVLHGPPRGNWPATSGTRGPAAAVPQELPRRFSGGLHAPVHDEQGEVRQPNIRLAQAVRPSAAVGYTLSEIAWSLGVEVDELRRENPDLNRFSSHERLPEDTQLYVTIMDEPAVTPSMEQQAIAQRAAELRQTQYRRPAQTSGSGSGGGATGSRPETSASNEERPRYQRCTSRSPSRSTPAATNLLGGSSDGAVSGLRTASNSIAPDTNLRRFVVTSDHMSVDLIARRLGVHPDVVYDLNTAELVDGPEGVYHFQQPLPVGMVLTLPSHSH